MILAQAAVVMIGVTATVTDFQARRIPNQLTLPFVLLGVLTHLVMPGPEGRLSGLYGFLAAGGIFLVLYFINVVGAGDVKMVMAMGALLGLKLALQLAISAIVFGGVLSLLALVFSGNAGNLLTAVRYLFWRVTGLAEPKVGEDHSSYRFPMAVAIFVAALATIWVATQQAQQAAGVI
jgi:prepilin peptidase CpaA